MKEVDILRVVPQSEQPFNGVGDWHREGEMSSHIKVSDMGMPLFHRLIKIHELVEDTLVRVAEISEETVNAFCVVAQPLVGSDDPKSPIYPQHMRATIIEMLVCDWCGIKWHDYNDFVNKYIREKT
jgi:hypothetical protein